MAPKRKAPETPETAALQRRSTRISSSAKKSRYFEDNSEDTVSQEEHTKAKSSAKRMPFRISAGSKLRIQESEDDDDDRDVLSSSSSEDDSLPPKVTYTPLPKLRPTDGIPYTPSRLHKNTLLFLSDLKANNKRPWLKSHDAEFRRALDDFNAYIASLTPKLIALDDTLPDLPLKDIIFRIYRDTRFSKDPTPYKPHFSAAWSRTGRKGPYAVYYLHVQPGEASFLGGGVFHPPAGPLAKVRASIDERPGRWRRVLGEEGFRRTFLGGVDEEGAVGEFVKRNREGALKTKPKVSNHFFFLVGFGGDLVEGCVG
jgi:uncharacterized protein (TIGR02453 family)